MSNLKRFVFGFIFSLFCLFSFCFNTAYAIDKEVLITFVGSLFSGKSALRARLAEQPFNFTVLAHTRRTDTTETLFFNANL